ncbi:MAG: hypothetical protein PHF79_00805 [Candidatus Pacebacteria bacterium]|nr:hypothetical protein [Candidatus Paceibacterota bacterium]
MKKLNWLIVIILGICVMLEKHVGPKVHLALNTVAFASLTLLLGEAVDGLRKYEAGRKIRRPKIPIKKWMWAHTECGSPVIDGQCTKCGTDVFKKARWVAMCTTCISPLNPSGECMKCHEIYDMSSHSPKISTVPA